MKLYFRTLKKSIQFWGRTERLEFFLFWSLHLAFCLGMLWIDYALNLMGKALISYLIITLPACLSITIRRLHDTGKTGFWVVIMLLPIVGWIILLWMLLQNGSSHHNRFGENPKYRF